MRLKSSCILLLWLYLVVPVVAWGELSSENIDQTLTKGSNPVWYSDKEKTLKFPTAESLQEAEGALKDRHRNTYVEQPVVSNPSRSSPWWDSIFESLSAFAPWLLWGLLALFVISVAVYFWFAVERGRGGFWGRQDPQAGDVLNHEKAKLVDLPFSVDASPRGLFEQAQAFRRDGDFSKSIVYLFSHILVEMDNANCIRLQRGKTNQVYLRELKTEPNLAKLFQHSARIFEAVFFGQYAVNQEQCERFWNLLPAIQQSIREAVQRRATSSEQELSAAQARSSSLTVSGIKSLGLILLASTIGCNYGTNLPLDNYGGSNAYHRKSVSGLTVFRELCEQHNLRTNELITLSERTLRLNAIVWAPKDFRVPNDEEIAWFEDWLSNHPARKLIFVGRDYSPLSHYWGEAAERAAPGDRRTFLLQQAYADSEFELVRMQSASKMKCAWFEQQLGKEVGRRIEKFKGPWAKNLDVDESEIVLRGKLIPLRASQTDDPTVQSEYGRSTVRTLLASDDGTAIVSSISHPRWGDSQLILVANGSLVMNESLTNRSNHRIAERLVEQCSRNGRIGFLSNTGHTKIRQPWDQQEPKGFEWLRVWPLSLIAIQGLFVGAIALLAMLPIFGRPQRLPSPSTTDFGKHIEALGDLLAQTRDRNYALQRIADYFRDVRHDSASPWSTVAAPVSKSKSKSKHNEPHSHSKTSIHSNQESS